MREDLENIQVKGKDVPKPIKTWPQARFRRRWCHSKKTVHFFWQAGVRAKILEVLRKCVCLCRVAKSHLSTVFFSRSGYEKPTPIQAQAIPAIMSGRDLIGKENAYVSATTYKRFFLLKGIAKTGSGKTLAFLLPLFRHVVDQPELAPGDGPIGEEIVQRWSPLLIILCRPQHLF